MSLTLDRTLAPALHPVVPQPFPNYEQTTLRSGIPVYIILHGNQPVVEVQLVQRAGQRYEPAPAVAGITARMLTEGTRNHTSTTLAQALDGFGASLNADAGYEMATLNLSTHARYLNQTFALMREVATEAVLPTPEFELLRTRSVRSLEVQARKTGWQARSRFAAAIYGAQHPYGRTAQIEDLNALQVEQLRGYYQTYLQPQNGFIIVAGRFEAQQMLDLLNEAFGQLKPASQAAELLPNTDTAKPGRIHYQMPENQQSTVMLGYPLFQRNHPDYHPMRLVTLLFGGYFGSRLMKNIREDKGYTYGINAQLSLFRDAGHLVIGADVANDYVENTISEVKREMERFCADVVSDDELLTGRNYLLGRILGSRETPFQIADQLKNLLLHSIPTSDVAEGVRVIQAMDPTSIRETAQRWLHPDRLVEVVCGG